MLFPIYRGVLMKHKKFLLIILAVLQIPISSACSTFSDNMRNGITASESTDATEILSSNLNHIEITQYDSPGHELSTIPLYFQQDYTSTPYNGGTLAEYGSLITCLSMLLSMNLKMNVTVFQTVIRPCHT